jgi:hypothetical protein
VKCQHNYYSKIEQKLSSSFNFAFRYIDDGLSLNNYKFGDFANHIYRIGLEIKDISDTARCASYIDLHLKIDNEGLLRTKFYDKKDEFKFPNVNFLFVCSNIPAALAYCVYLSFDMIFQRV